MELRGGIGQDAREKLAAEKAYTENPGPQTQVTGCDKPAMPHPRESLLRDINEHEQQLLDGLVVLRQLRAEFNCLGRYEAEAVLKITRLGGQLR